MATLVAALVELLKACFGPLVAAFAGWQAKASADKAAAQEQLVEGLENEKEVSQRVDAANAAMLASLREQWTKRP